VRAGRLLLRRLEACVSESPQLRVAEQARQGRLGGEQSVEPLKNTGRLPLDWLKPKYWIHLQ
jgi:hypothetical protein